MRFPPDKHILLKITEPIEPAEPIPKSLDTMKRTTHEQLFKYIKSPAAGGGRDGERACTHHGGRGSGKTKALTCRIAYMLEQGIYPNEILAITFTNKAAQEMRERVHNLVGPAADRIWMYTFHSFGARFLRREIASYPPYTDRFTIMTRMTRRRW